jgi:hypothetical protein
VGHPNGVHRIDWRSDMGWLTVLVLAVPATLVGVLVMVTIEHFLVSALTKRNLP